MTYIRSNFYTNSIAPSSDYTITTQRGAGETFIVTASANININLPSAASCGNGYQYNIKSNANGYTITLVRNGSELIDNKSSVSIINRYESLTLQSNGTNWFIV